MKVLYWHRRDLRIDDNAALYKALKTGSNVLPVFIFDNNILDDLPKDDQRVLFIHQTIEQLKSQYQSYGSDLQVYYGNPIELIPQIAFKNKVSTVYVNRDYEPYALKRDKQVYDLLKLKGIEFLGAKDHVVFEKNEILKADGKPYTVYTPYSKKWKALLNPFYLKAYPAEKYAHNLIQVNNKTTLISLKEMGFESEQKVKFPSPKVNESVINKYDVTRDIPSVLGTSRLSLHLRFGTISIRKLATIAKDTNEKYLNELIWRDFYQMIIFHFPHSVDKAFKPVYDNVIWENDKHLFSLWCEGKTGYPIVDAGMRELNQTGFMHNRVRMITASFLVKHLLVDWRWGEAYFAEKLLDFELASNVGGWQWAASSGCDAAPYFRVFNPTLQQEKFDKDFRYIKKWIPEFGTKYYPKPIVEHKFARERVIQRYKEALSN
ncbi:MAG: cryptochrome/photolyase family protein [Crocinitomicaceae bacterium]